MIEKFTARFEETVFTLISKFNEIHDGFSRVQEALDYLGKLQVQAAENKQIMTKVDQSFKNLERKLREMSEDGFVIPAGAPLEAKAKDESGMGSLLSATAVERPSIDTKEEVQAMKTAIENESSKKIEKKKGKTKEKVLIEEQPIPAPVINPPTNPVSNINPIPAQKPINNSTTIPTPNINPIPIPTPVINPTPVPNTSNSLKTSPSNINIAAPSHSSMSNQVTTKPLPETKTVFKPSIPSPSIILEQSPSLTPVPKFETKGFITPLPDHSKIKSNPTPVSPISTEPKSMEKSKFTPMPVAINPTPVTTISVEPKPAEKSGFTPMPAPPKAQSGAGTANQQTIETPATPRVAEVRGVQDVWQNLVLDIKESETYEQASYSLGLANDNLKKFVRFHKVLFEVLKLASDYRRKGGNTPIITEDKEVILKKVESWKFELR